MTGIVPPASPASSTAPTNPIAKLIAFLRAPHTSDRGHVTPEQLHPPGSTQPAFVERTDGWRFLMCLVTFALPLLGLLRLSRPRLAIAVLGLAWGPYIAVMARIIYGDPVPLATQEAWIGIAKAAALLVGLGAAIYCWTANRWHSTTPHWSSHGLVLLFLFLTMQTPLDYLQSARQDRYAAELSRQAMLKFERDQQRAAATNAAKTKPAP